MMTTQNRIKTVLTLAVVAMAAVALTSSSANAATMSSSITAPDIGSLDIANYGAATGTDKWWSDAATSGRPKGQTFTTGSDPVKLGAITYQIVNTQKAEPTKEYVIRVSTVNRVDPGNSATWVLTPIHSETATQDFTWNPGTPDTSEYMTWTLDEPLLLSPDTEYGIDIGMTSSTSVWQTGIPYLNRTGDAYAGGTRYMSGTTGLGIGDTTMNNVSGDMKFHLDMLTSDPTLPTVDAGADVISWSGQAVQLDPNVVNNSDPVTDLTYAWSADPVDGVVFSATDVEAPTVTITKATDNPSVVTVTLAVNNVGSGKDDMTDSMMIDVYDDSCLAAQAVGPVAFDITDIDENCVTAFPDFALMAMTWLDDYTLTGPVAK
jgi:hypothetical protein